MSTHIVEKCAVTAEENWERLRRDYAHNGIALALGAGVSIDSKLPHWRELLERIAEKCFENTGKKLVDEMIGDGFSLPAIAGILEAECPAEKNFSELIRDALYEKFEFYRRKSPVQNKAEFVDYVKTNNPTLAAVAALCVRKPSNSNYITNPLVHAIANSNFDAILRAYSNRRYQPHILRTVDRPSAKALPERINVYHVHGFFQFDEKYIGDATKEAPDIRVFTEHEYFDFFNQPTGLFSYTFLYLLREFIVLFIGMSLKDDNIRRLLHYSREEIRGSYVKEGESSYKALKKSLRHYAIQKRTKSPQLNDLTEVSLRRLGVRTLWIDKFTEIPTRLQELYESTGDKWSDVY